MELKQILLGNTSKAFSLGKFGYDDIDESFEGSVREEVEKAIQLFFELNKKFSYTENFNAEGIKWDIVQEYAQKDIRTYLKNGIESKIDEIKRTGIEPKVEETFFFYPLVGILNMMAQKVYE